MRDYGTPKADFLEEAMRILDAASERGITICLIGAVAMRVRYSGTGGVHTGPANGKHIEPRRAFH